MVKRNSVRITIYGYSEMYAGGMPVYSDLVKFGYTNVQFINNPSNLLDVYEYHTDNIPEIMLVDMAFANKTFNGFQVLKDIKVSFPDIIVICINNKEEIADVLRSNCDSFVDKTSSTYLKDLKKIVDHWSKYVTERNSLNYMYQAILGE